jgi:hypothetical protein
MKTIDPPLYFVRRGFVRDLVGVRTTVLLDTFDIFELYGNEYPVGLGNESFRN